MRARLMGLMMLAGCAATTPAPVVAPPRAEALPPGLALIERRTEAEVVARIGAPSMARSEGPARQLQFIRPPCVLDVFLYPDAGPGAGGVQRVRTAFARRPDGSAMPPGDCLRLILPAAPPAPPSGK
jgi:hypothetical protein